MVDPDDEASALRDLRRVFQDRLDNNDRTSLTHPDLYVRELAAARMGVYRLVVWEVETAIGKIAQERIMRAKLAMNSAYGKGTFPAWTPEEVAHEAGAWPKPQSLDDGEDPRRPARDSVLGVPEVDPRQIPLPLTERRAERVVRNIEPEDLSRCPACGYLCEKYGCRNQEAGAICHAPGSVQRARRP